MDSVKLKNDNMFIVFEILNSLQKIKINIFTEIFIEAYAKNQETHLTPYNDFDTQSIILLF